MLPQEERDFLLAAAAWQDSLLQSYRATHVTLEAILLAVGIGLAAIPLTSGAYPSHSTSSIVSAVLLLAITALSLYVNQKFGQIVRARVSDVDYWHLQIIEIEKQLPSPARHFTRFKIHQQSHRGAEADVSRLTAAFLSDGVQAEVDNADVMGKGCGHTRTVIDRQLFLWINVIWGVLLFVTLGGLIWSFS